MNLRTTRCLVLLPLLLASASCFDTLEPDVGLLQSSACVNADSEPSEDVSFRDDIVAGMLMPEPLGCLQCHAPNSPTPIGFQISGLNLSSYATLIRGGLKGGSATVIPGQPCESILLQKILPGPPFGARMPIGGPPYVSKDQQQLLHDWIAEGAKNN